MIGTTISHYKVIEKVGAGGMGTVYKAFDTKLERFVAIKVLPPHLSEDEEGKKRFIHEAKAASSLDHLNIGTIYEIDETQDGQTFIVMAYYEGCTLREMIDRGRIDARQALAIAEQVASGLARAHEQGIIHRDIKPSNIIITKHGEAKIVDFGVAKLAGKTSLTKAGSLLGTVAYMSPEVVKGEGADQRSDIFSLGVILYEMLTGERPFTGEYEAAVLYGIVHEEPVFPDGRTHGAGPDIEAVVLRMLAKDPDDRYRYVAELLRDLESVRTGSHGIAAKHPRSKRRGPLLPFGRRAWIVVTFAAVVSAALYMLFPRAEAIDSIAVLPLENLSREEGEEYFVSGMTDELISRLAQIGGLKVISRTSIMNYRGSSKPLPEIASELKVKAVLEGSVLRVGNRVRIAVELIHAGTDRSMWAESYERSVHDVLRLQSEVAQDIAHKIKVKLTSHDREELANVPSVNVEAHEAYLKGRYYMNQRTPDALSAGLKYFQLSIEKDSSYAPAYAGMADSYILLAGYSLQDPDEVYTKAQQAALKAIGVDDRLAEAHTSLAIVKWHYEWDFEEAEREFKRALALNPNYSTAHHWYALYLSFVERREEAVAEIRNAQSVDPVSLIVNAAVGLVYYYADRYDEALEQSRLTLDMNDGFFPAYTVRGRAYMQKGLYAEAIEAFDAVIGLSGRRSSALSLLAHPLAASGRMAEAEALYEELVERSGNEYVSPFDMAVMTMALGRRNETLDWLERAYAERAFDIMSMQAEPLFYDLHDETRFVELAHRVGLAPRNEDSP
jgi:serine/threonine protein kinase/tetratricopeptide (TPR) repeat protein